MRTILAVDDDHWVLETLKDALNIKGYRVLVARSADDAQVTLKTNEVHLILLDLNMPGKNGFALFRELEAWARIPVLFVSGCSRSFSGNSSEFVSVWTNEFTLGATDILYKPFSLQLLYEKVEALIGPSEVTTSEPAH